MKLKELIARALRREELNALERAELENFDPDALREKLDELERSRLSREEALQRDLEAAAAEREQLRAERDGLLRKNRIAAIAADCGCTDPEYLDFLAGRQTVDINDPAAVAKFVARTERDSPHCFRSRLRPGSGTPATSAAGAGNEAVPDRIGAIAAALGTAPDAVV